MKILEWVFDVIEQGLGIVFVLIMFISILIQIFFRYVLSSPLTWTDEAARYSFIWAVFLGASFAVRKNEHVLMEVLICRFPRSVQRYIKKILDVIILISLIYLWPVSWSFFLFMKNVSAPTINISWGFLFFAAPLSIALMIIHLFIRLIGNRYEVEQELLQAGLS